MLGWKDFIKAANPIPVSSYRRFDDKSKRSWMSYVKAPPPFQKGHPGYDQNAVDMDGFQWDEEGNRIGDKPAWAYGHEHYNPSARAPDGFMRDGSGRIVPEMRASKPKAQESGGTIRPARKSAPEWGWYAMFGANPSLDKTIQTGFDAMKKEHPAAGRIAAAIGNAPQNMVAGAGATALLSATAPLAVKSVAKHPVTAAATYSAARLGDALVGDTPEATYLRGRYLRGFGKDFAESPGVIAGSIAGAGNGLYELATGGNFRDGWNAGMESVYDPWHEAMASIARTKTPLTNDGWKWNPEEWKPFSGEYDEAHRRLLKQIADEKRPLESAKVKDMGDTLEMDGGLVGGLLGGGNTISAISKLPAPARIAATVLPQVGGNVVAVQQSLDDDSDGVPIVEENANLEEDLRKYREFMESQQRRMH